uniref:Bgt_avrF2_20 n=1 Tax=Blumeria graminis f. sp. tritici 96224 TaxID=1268274 RepID=A0A381L3M7_BLUGR
MKVSSLLSYAAFLNYLLPVSAVLPVTNFKCWNKVISCAIIQEAIDREYAKMGKPTFTEWKQVVWIKAIVDGRGYGCEPTDELGNSVVQTGPGRYQYGF